MEALLLVILMFIMFNIVMSVAGWILMTASVIVTGIIVAGMNVIYFIGQQLRNTWDVLTTSSPIGSIMEDKTHEEFKDEISKLSSKL